MCRFNEKKHNGLEFIYELLFIYYQAYCDCGITDRNYNKFKSELFADNSWKERYSKISGRKYKKYNLSALLALIRLFDNGAISKEEYDNERKKIVIEYKEKSIEYYDL